MEQPHSATDIRYVPQEADVSLLDILVTLAENIKLLIIGPLLVGLCALGIAFVVPQTFESVAVLEADPSIASLMTSANVLDPVASALGLTKDQSAEEARRRLLNQIQATASRDGKLITLAVGAGTAQQAQAIANAVLEQTYLQSRPKADERARLEARLQSARGLLKDAEDAAAILSKRLTTISTTGNGAEPVRGYADLLGAAAAAQNQVDALETLVTGLSDAKLVQTPTLPQKATKPRKAVLAVGAALAAGLLLLLFVFARQALRDTAQDAEAAAKVTRIRRALGLQ